jgi:hypothetical protein
VDKPLSLRSVNGPGLTQINGGSSVRCAFLTNGASLSGFTLTNGYSYEGGGVSCSSTTAVVANCVITHCSTCGGSGGGSAGGTLNNCLLTGNFVCTNGGGAYGGILNNCTLVGNSAGFFVGRPGGGGGNPSGGGAYQSTLNNCILFFNNSRAGSNYDGGTLNFCCTTPLPSGGVGNFVHDPLFVDRTIANYRLRPESPCVNAGNNSSAQGATDLDGNPRIYGTTVDLGCYESQVPHTPTAPFILTQPAGQTVNAGLNAFFSVTADGDYPLAYQWRFNGIEITSATNTWVVVTNVQLPNAGNYSVLISNQAGTIFSSNASLVVVPPPPCFAFPPGLVSWWRAEGDYTDSIGGNLGTPYNGVTFATGLVGRHLISMG